MYLKGLNLPLLSIMIYFYQFLKNHYWYIKSRHLLDCMLILLSLHRVLWESWWLTCESLCKVGHKALISLGPTTHGMDSPPVGETSHVMLVHLQQSCRHLHLQWKIINIHRLYENNINIHRQKPKSTLYLKIKTYLIW